MEGPIAKTMSAVLDFWFGLSEVGGPSEFREAWFKSDAAFDGHIREAFLADYERAAGGELDHLLATGPGCLVLVLLLDQFPRNMFRDTPRAFVTDGTALAVTCHALSEGFGQTLSKWPRLFLCLPLEHSEVLADQERSVALLSRFADPEQIDYAVRHRDVIARFARFPHRNAVLGRANTPEEVEFLKEEGSAF